MRSRGVAPNPIRKEDGLVPEFHFDARGNPTTVPPMTEDILDVLPENIPQRLKDIPRWLVWKAIPKPDGSGYTKPPHQARNPRLAASTKNPHHWATFDEAVAAYRANPDIAGIGLVAHKDDGLTYFDFDHCVEKGEIAPWVEQHTSSRSSSALRTSPAGMPCSPAVSTPTYPIAATSFSTPTKSSLARSLNEYNCNAIGFMKLPLLSFLFHSLRKRITRIRSESHE